MVNKGKIVIVEQTAAVYNTDIFKSTYNGRNADVKKIIRNNSANVFFGI